MDALDRQVGLMHDTPPVDESQDAWPGASPKVDRRKPARRAVSPAVLNQVAEGFLERTCAADTHDAPGVGLGRDLRLVAPQISGAALNANDSLVHLSAFHM